AGAAARAGGEAGGVSADNAEAPGRIPRPGASAFLSVLAPMTTARAALSVATLPRSLRFRFLLRPARQANQLPPHARRGARQWVTVEGLPGVASPLFRGSSSCR